MNRILITTTTTTLAAIILVLLFASNAQAQLTNTTGSLSGLRGAPLVHKFDARTTAMGNATVADASGLGSININPALLSFVRNLQVLEVNTHQNWENNIMANTVALPPASLGQHRALLQLGYHGRGLEQTILSGPGSRPVPDLSLYQADLVYSYSFSNIISLGVLQSFSMGQNRQARYWSYSTGVGLLYAPSESISYGLVYRGLGRSVIYEIIEDGRTTLGSQRLRETLELGATLTFPVDTDQTYLAISLSNEKRFGEDGIWYKAGAEVKVIRMLKLRSGILFNSDSYQVEPRFGAGIDLGRLLIDYTLSVKEQDIDRFHQLGFTFQF